MLRRLLLLSLPLMAASLFPAEAKQTPQKNVLSQTITDEAIIYPESFEVDTQKLLESWYLKNYTATDTRYKTMSDVKTSDAEIKRRLSEMPTVIEMPFNQIVRQYIDRYTQKGRSQVAAMLGLGIYYNPIFEQALEEEGVPLELKYLPVIESALNPNATSHAGAAGLWQFMLVTGKGLGMEVNSVVDERRDPYISSHKAAKYLKDLYSTYNDWSLAIAAYNCGPGTVNKAIRRAGGDPSKKDFWSIYNYLPSETRGYVPAFIAANYVMTYYPEHNISPVLPTKPLITDTVSVSKRVHFDQISSVLNIPKEELRVLNPQFRADVIPGTPSRPYSLILPSQQIHAYILSEDDIVNYQRSNYAQRSEVKPGDQIDDFRETAIVEEDETPENPSDLELAINGNNNEYDEEEAAPAPAPVRKRKVTHTVAEGESLADIATAYGVSASDIRRSNSLRRNAVRAGQQLTIETPLSERELASRRPAASRPSKDVAQQTAPARRPAESQQPTAQPSQPANNTREAAPARRRSEAQTQQQPAKTRNTAQNTTQVSGRNERQNDVKADRTNRRKNRQNTTAAAAETQNVKETGKNRNNSKAQQQQQQKTNQKDQRNQKNQRNQKDQKRQAAQAAPQQHTVSSGENLTTIAKRNGVSVEDLKKANPKAGDMIHPGDKITIPKKNSKASKGNDNSKGNGNDRNASGKKSKNQQAESSSKGGRNSKQNAEGKSSSKRKKRK